MTSSQIIPLDHIVLLAAVTFLGILEQAYFALQVIAARRKYNVPAPKTSGSEEFDRIFRAQVNCTEYFPMFLASLWLAGLFFHQGTAAACGLVYLYARYRYFTAYKESSKLRVGPMYFNASVLWVLIGMAAIGILHTMSRIYLGWIIL
ncbi:leukotriene C4 synthase-like isoform 2-T2 [Discoglossus pictus]